MGRMIRLASILMLGAATAESEAPPQEDGDAEAVSLYRKMADTLRKARTLQLTCKARFKTDGFQADVQASLLLKEGNKSRLEVDIHGTRNGEPYAHRMSIVSNGSLLRLRENQDPSSSYATSRHWNEAMLLNIIRGGFPTGLELDRLKSKEANPKDDVGLAFLPIPEPTGFTLWKKEELNGHRTTPIEFKVKGDSAFFRENAVILWIDDTTAFPVKRMNVLRSDRTLNVTETYESVSINDELDDARFDPSKE